LTWTASTDDTGISSYDIFRNGAVIGTSSDTMYTNSGLSASTTYTYTIKAIDTTGYVSNASKPVSFIMANPSGVVLILAIKKHQVCINFFGRPIWQVCRATIPRTTQ
jgi:hypothetical protein